MKLTTKAHYAVTAMLDMAIYDHDSPVKVQDMASRHGIPLAYLERLTGQMRAKGLLQSVRGPGGGYVLAKEPEQISVAEIIDAVEDTLDATRCGGMGNCQQGTTCLTHHLWDALNHQMLEFLQTMTLAKLSNLPNVKDVANKKIPCVTTGKDG